MRALLLSLIAFFVVVGRATSEEKKLPVVVDALQSREVTADGTRVVLLSVSPELQFGTAPGAGPVMCLRVKFLTEFIGDEKIKNLNVGMVEVRQHGVNRVIWPVDGSATRQRHLPYDDQYRWSLLEPPEVASSERAFVHEFSGTGGVTEKQVDLVLKDVGFNDVRNDFVFRNVSLK